MSKPVPEKAGDASKSGSAPPYPFTYDNAVSMRAPPPTYEQSQQQRLNHAQGPTEPVMPMHIPSNQYYGMTHHQQLPIYHGSNYSLVGPSTSSGPAVSQILNIHPRATLRTTTAGAVVVPPPPPGCLPTPAQLAAMQGQPVVVQQKKRSFI